MTTAWTAPVLVGLLLVAGCTTASSTASPSESASPPPIESTTDTPTPTPTPTRADVKTVTAAQLGAHWPLIASSAVIACPEPGVAVITVNGRTYALNGTAKDRQRWPDFDTQRALY